jgi:DNA-binding Xre family transcriptional regulator
MHFCYNKLFKLLIDRGLKKKDLCKLAGISSTSVAKLGRGDNVNTEVLCKICGALNCNVCDIMEFVRGFETTNTSSKLD